MSTIIEIVDKTGQLRRCGTQVNGPDFACKLKAYSDIGPMYTDDEIKKIITDPNRPRARVTFDKSWILDQLHYASCEGHAEAAATMRTRFRRGLKKELLSGAYAYSKVNHGVDDGAHLVDGLAAVQKWGMAPLKLVNAHMIFPHLQPAGIDAIAAKIKVNVAYSLPDLASLRSALAAGFDCVAAVEVGNNFEKLNSDGVCGADAGRGNHAVALDDLGFVHGKWLYDMPNSWAFKFGQFGRGYLRDRNLVDTIGAHMFYAVASTNEA